MKKGKKKYKLKKKFVIFFSIYFVLFVSFFTVKTLSKYNSILVDKEGSVAIAKWSVSLDTSSSNNNISLISGNETTTQNYILTVTSTSEVALDCSLVLKNVPAGLKASINGGDLASENDEKIIINNFGHFDADDVNSSKEYTLTFVAPIGMSSVTDKEIDMDVIFTQEVL